MGRVYNFSAGPAVLPEEVLKEAADEMLDYKGTGMSVMEMSHRSKAFDDIIKDRICVTSWVSPITIRYCSCRVVLLSSSQPFL